MNERKNHLSLLALAAVLLLSVAVAAVAADQDLVPAQATPTVEPVPAETPATPDPSAIDAEKTFVVDPPDDCQLTCMQEFTACRQAAGNSGGPGFPAQAYEDCVDELDWCFMEQCGICV